MIDIDVCDPRIAYLHNALLIEEEMLPKLGIKIGILGQERSNYDLMLMLLDSENSNHVEKINQAEKSYEKKSSISDKLAQNSLVCFLYHMYIISNFSMSCINVIRKK